jgi:hypothetical protein
MISITVQTFEYEPHNPKPYKGIPWSVCVKCGLVYLRNELTAWCVKKGCNASDHPQYKRMCQQLIKETKDEE